MSEFQFCLLLSGIFVAVSLRDNKGSCTLLACVWVLLALVGKAFE